LIVRANLIIGADGRHSAVRAQAGLQIEEFGAPMDVLWFRLARRPDDPEDPVGRFDTGRIFIMLNRGDYWQCGFVIAKGSHAQIREQGLMVFREKLAPLAPFIAIGLAIFKTGKRSSSLPFRLIDCVSGIVQVFSASVMRRMRCLRSEASASISPFKMQSPHRICWLRRYRGAT
jgi:2-polyprenyl-6-methoxyphenol hydroxylase-like FAD-dependent oxidoreductase